MGFNGIEAHPLIAELAGLKLLPNPPSPDELVGDATRVAALAARHVESLEPMDLTAETTLVVRSFSPEVLRQLVALRTAVQNETSHPSFPYLKWALLATLRDVAGVKVGWPYQRPGVSRTPRHQNPMRRFGARVLDMAEDLRGLRSTSGSATVVNGDSRDPAVWGLLPGSAQACVSSPPYLNNFDYADATRLELYFWGEVRSWREMCSTVRVGMLTATTQQSSKPEKTEALQQLRDGAGGPGLKIVSLAEQLGHIRRERSTRSKEYDQVVPAYFLGMWQVLQNLYAHLDPGSPAIWLVGDSAPYGVHIDTPALIGEFAALTGFEIKEDVLLRRRGARWASNASRTAAQLSERALVLRRP